AEGRKDVLAYMRGGFWRVFLAKYPDANLLHKKMLRVHAKVHLARALGLGRDALDDLWKGQCNCPYWHGVFGGLYLADVRSANYRHLLRAESAADRVLQQASSWLEVEESDYDCDGHEELLVESRALGLYLRPAEGGSLCEWDLRGRDWNVQSTVARRPEAYHAALREALRQEAEKPAGRVETIHAGVRVKDMGGRVDLDYDRHPRYSLIDHVLPEDTTLDDFARCRYQELGDFAAGVYRATRRRGKRDLTIALERKGRVLIQGRAQPLHIRKELRVRPDSAAWRVIYHVRNASDAPLRALFAPEWNLNMLAGGRNPLATFETLPGGAKDVLDGESVADAVEHAIVQNSGLGVRLRLSFGASVRLWRFSVESVSNSEAGVERLYQGTCLAPLFPLDLAPGVSVTFEMGWASEGVK
ncbi:MAG: alpha-amylase/4-alpha-glucanotransferase domain-containing protein, partial [Chloroflexota bacterium]